MRSVPKYFTSCDYGTPEGIRTPDLWYRKPTLYPAELRVHAVSIAQLKVTAYACFSL